MDYKFTHYLLSSCSPHSKRDRTYRPHLPVNISKLVKVPSPYVHPRKRTDGEGTTNKRFMSCRRVRDNVQGDDTYMKLVGTRELCISIIKFLRTIVGVVFFFSSPSLLQPSHTQNVFLVILRS